MSKAPTNSGIKDDRRMLDRKEFREHQSTWCAGNGTFWHKGAGAEREANKRRLAIVATARAKRNRTLNSAS